jgi:hypothetical protein
MVITSMNMYEFSEKNNREMGVLVESSEAVYQEAVTEARSIVAAAEAAVSPRPRGHHQLPKRGTPGFASDVGRESTTSLSYRIARPAGQSGPSTRIPTIERRYVTRAAEERRRA